MSRASGKPNGVFHEKERHDGEGSGENGKRGKIAKSTKKFSIHLLNGGYLFPGQFSRYL